MAVEYGSPEYYALVQDYGAGGMAGEMTFQRQMAALEAAETAAAGPTVWEKLGDAFGVGIQAVGKWNKVTAERDKAKFERDLAKLRIQQGMTGRGVGPTFGGLNWLTIVAFGGVGILALLILKKGMF